MCGGEQLGFQTGYGEYHNNEYTGNNKKGWQGNNGSITHACSRGRPSAAGSRQAGCLVSLPCKRTNWTRHHHAVNIQLVGHMKVLIIITAYIELNNRIGFNTSSVQVRRCEVSNVRTVGLRRQKLPQCARVCGACRHAPRSAQRCGRQVRAARAAVFYAQVTSFMATSVRAHTARVRTQRMPMFHVTTNQPTVQLHNKQCSILVITGEWGSMWGGLTMNQPTGVHRVFYGGAGSGFLLQALPPTGM